MSNTTLPAGESRDTAPTAPKKISREELERLTSQLIRTLHRRTTAHRFKPSAHDGPRLQYSRACIAAVTAYAALLKDSELGELEQRISELEKTRLRE